MTHYHRQLIVSASPAAVYEALTTEAGLRRWWTQTCEVDAEEGGLAVFRFGPHHKTMRIERLDAPREVRWRCEDACLAVPGMPPDEWIGTTIVFRLTSDDHGGTLLDLEHVGLEPALACWELCRAGWDDFLASLKALLEQGQGRPFIPAASCAASAAPARETALSGAKTEVSDRIERSIVIQAPRAKVWRLLSNAESFGKWFGADLSGQHFVPGEVTRGPIIMPGFTHVMFEVKVVHIVPLESISWRWHPYAVDPEMDYGGEEPTLVTWTLHDAPNGATLVKTVESGFDKVPPHRRMEAFRMNSSGWEAQLENVRHHAEQND